MLAFFTITIIVALLCSVPRQASAKFYYDEKDLIELKCAKGVQPATSPELDLKWMQSVDTWYSGYGSQLDIYRRVAQALNSPGSPLKVKDDDLYYKMCPTIQRDDDKIMRFHTYGVTEPLVLQPTGKGTLGGFRFPMSNLRLTGHATFPLTDNKTYALVVNCWSDGTASWAVIHSTIYLPDEIMAKIHAYVKSLGFIEKHFMYVRYDSCPAVKKQAKTVKGQKPEKNEL